MSLWALLGAMLLAIPAALHAETCERLAARSTATREIHSQRVAAGTLTPPGDGTALTQLPPFCRAMLRLAPTGDSDIGAEVWLPENWNGRLLVVGNGGWGGAPDYGQMAAGLRRGYAVAATDDGNKSHGARFLMGHPEKFIDFAYRAQHETTLAAKALVKALYAREPSRSYWQGCSGGGREGLIQAWRYPDEFDGVIAGDPANVRRNAWALWLAVQTLSDPAAYIPPAKYPMIHNAVLAACDASDGLQDGLISQPERCHIDFALLQCKAGDSPQCLTPAQVRSAQTLLSPAISHGTELFPRLEPGTELRWGRLAGGPAPADLFLDQFRYVVYQNPDWDWRGFDLERDAARANAIDRDIDELDPHLAASRKPARSAPRFMRLAIVYRLRTWRRSRRPVASCSCITAGRISRSRRVPRSSSIRRCAVRAPTHRMPMTGCGCSWRPEWPTAGAVRGPIPSTAWGPWSTGCRTATRPTRSSPPTGRRAGSTVPDPCVPIPRWRATRAPAASTRLQISSAPHRIESGGLRLLHILVPVETAGQQHHRGRASITAIGECVGVTPAICSPA